MKTITVGLLVSMLLISAQAKSAVFACHTGWYSNVCSNGSISWTYPLPNAQPIGTQCAIPFNGGMIPGIVVNFGPMVPAPYPC